MGNGGSQTRRMQKFVMVSSRLDSFLLTESSILDSCYEIWEYFANSYRGPRLSICLSTPLQELRSAAELFELMHITSSSFS